MQSLAEKVESLKTVLPLIWAHLYLLPGSKVTASYGMRSRESRGRTAALGAPDCDGPARNASMTRLLGRCLGGGTPATQPEASDHRGIGTAEDLDYREHRLAHAVVAVYVDPYEPLSEPVSTEDQHERRCWRRRGVTIAMGIRGTHWNL